MRQSYRKFVLALACLSLLTACGEAPSQEPTAVSTPQMTPSANAVTLTAAATSSPTSEPTSQPSRLGIEPQALNGISIQFWQGLPEEDGELLTALAADFSNSNEYGIHIEVLYQSPYLESIDQALLAGEPPDIALALNHQAAAWTQLGFATVDLNPYINDADYGLAKKDASDFIETFYAQGVYSTTRLTFPFYRQAHLLYFNETWAQDLGYSAPPSSMAEFEMQSCAAANASLTDDVLENDGRGGWIVEPSYRPTLAWIFAQGGAIVDNATLDYRIPEAEQALTLFHTMANQGCSWLAEPGAVPGAFARREALFISGSTADLARIQQEFERAGSLDQWRPIPYPGQAEPVVLAQGPGLMLFKSDETRELAGWLFIRWLTSPEVQTRWSRGTGSFPVRKAVLQQLTAERHPLAQWQQTAPLMLTAAVDPTLPAWDQLRWVLSDATSEIYRIGFEVSQIPDLLSTLTELSRELNTRR